MEEMGTKKTGKIVAVIAAVVVVVLGLSVGVMAATGVFSSGKSKAFDLLAEVPEKLSYSSVNEYIGTTEMSKAMLEKGGQTGFKISNLTLDSSLAPNGLDLSGFSAEISAKADKAKEQTSMLMSLEKGGSKLSLNTYVDKEKTVLSIPELVSGKVFSIDYKALQDAVGSATQMATASPEMEKFVEDLQEFFEDEIEKVKDDISCEKLSGDKAGYKLVIKKESMDAVLNDFVEFMEKQDSIVKQINSWVQMVMYRTSFTETFDLITELKEVVSELQAVTQDFTFEVYGEGKNLKGLATTFTIEGIPFKASMDFEGDKGNSTATMKLSTDQGGSETGITVIIKDTKADTYENSFSLDITAVGVSAGGVTITETINPSDNSYALNGSFSMEGNEFAKVTATGAVKDLKQGSYANLVLDDVTASVNGVEYVKLALDIKMGVIDGSIEPPQGEEVQVTNTAGILPYLTEVQTALTKIMNDWGISIPTGGYNPMGGGTTTPSLNMDDYLTEDRSSLDDDNSLSDDGSSTLDDDSSSLDDSASDIGDLAAS